MSIGRLIGWLIAALFGGGTAILINQHFIENHAPEVDAQPIPVMGDGVEKPKSIVPPPLTGPENARRIVMSGLNDLGLSSQSIRQGRYPLRGQGRNLSDVMPLISFECTMDQGCPSLLAALERRLAAAGMALARPRSPDVTGRPVYRAVFQDGRPALALRAYPPGGRIAVVIEGVGQDLTLLESIDDLDPDITYGVLANGPQAPRVAEQLRDLGREFIAHLPMGKAAVPEVSTSAALNMQMTPGEIAEQTQAYIDTIRGAAGVNGQQNESFASSSSHMSPVFEVLAENGRYFFDQRPSDASVAGALAQALGVRTVSRTHRIDDSTSIDAQLQAVRVALVLDGEAVVVVQPKPRVISALKPWLAELRKRKFNVMRLSEIVL